MGFSGGIGFANGGGNGGGSTPFLTDTEIAFGSPINTIQSSASFTYDLTTSTFSLGFGTATLISGVGDSHNISVVLGDVDKIANRTQISIQDNSNEVIVYGTNNGAGGYGEMLYLDGEQFFFSMGDISGVQNQTSIEVNDTHQFVAVNANVSGTNEPVLLLNAFDGIYTMGDTQGNLNNTNIIVNDTESTIAISNAFSTPTMQEETSGASSYSLPSTVRGVYIDPATEITSLNILLPAPVIGCEFLAIFGGQITTGSVVKVLTFTTMAGQVIVGIPPAVAIAGQFILLKYRDNFWYITLL